MTVLPRPWTLQGWWPLDFTLILQAFWTFLALSALGSALSRVVPGGFCLYSGFGSAVSGCLDFALCGSWLSRLLARSLPWLFVVLTVAWLLLVLFPPRLPHMAIRPPQAVGFSLSVIPPRLRLWLCFLCLWRVGEAYKPGPEFTVGLRISMDCTTKLLGLPTLMSIPGFCLKHTSPQEGSSAFSPTCGRRRPPTRPSSMDALLPQI